MMRLRFNDFAQGKQLTRELTVKMPFNVRNGKSEKEKQKQKMRICARKIKQIHTCICMCVKCGHNNGEGLSAHNTDATVDIWSVKEASGSCDNASTMHETVWNYKCTYVCVYVCVFTDWQVECMPPKTNNNNNSNKIVTFIFRAFEYFKRKIFFTVDLCVFVVLFSVRHRASTIVFPCDSVNKCVCMCVCGPIYTCRAYPAALNLQRPISRMHKSPRVGAGNVVKTLTYTIAFLCACVHTRVHVCLYLFG